MSTKTILITGSTSGIGQAIMQKYLHEGYRVLCLNRSTLSIHEPYQSQVYQFITDFNYPQQVIDTCSLVREKFRHIDILVNNAGIMYPEERFNGYVDQLQEMMNINMIAPMIIVSQLAPLLIRCEGIVINIGSLASYLPIPSQATYSSIKVGLSKFSDIIRYELNPLGVKVVEVSPGSTESNILRNLNMEYIEEHQVSSESRLSASEVADTCFLVTTLAKNTQISRLVIEPMR